MEKDEYRNRVKQLIEKSKKKGLIKTYSEFLETQEAKEYSLVQEEVERFIETYQKYLESK